MQVAEARAQVRAGTPLTVVPLYGGAPMHQQIRALERGADIVVATPGRALDHLRRGHAEARALEVARARRGRRDARHGLRRGPRRHPRPTTPETRQTALFAATMPPRILSIAATHLQRPDARHHRAREARGRQAAARPPGRLRRGARAQAGGARPRARHREPRRRRSSSAARGSRSTSSSTCSTRTATAPRRCTAAWNSASATA